MWQWGKVKGACRARAVDRSDSVVWHALRIVPTVAWGGIFAAFVFCQRIPVVSQHSTLLHDSYKRTLSSTQTSSGQPATETI